MNNEDVLTPGEDWLSETVRRLSGLVDLDVLAARAASELHNQLGDHLICVTTVEPDSVLLVRGVEGGRGQRVRGLRIPLGKGVGGRAVAEQTPVSVAEYATEVTGPYFIDIMAHEEGVRGAAGVPLFLSGKAVGVLFVGKRDMRQPSERELELLQRIAGRLSPLFGVSQELKRRLDLALSSERQRFATELHESTIPSLFAIGAAAHRAHDIARSTDPTDNEELILELQRIQALSSSAGESVRRAVTATVPNSRRHAVPRRLQTDIEQFTSTTGIPADLIVLGESVPIRPEIADLLVAALREGLSNVARHAPDASVLACMSHLPDGVELVVQDDGPGLDSSFALNCLAADQRQFGLVTLMHRLSLVDGTLSITDNDDRGTSLRITVPNLHVRP